MGNISSSNNNNVTLRRRSSISIGKSVSESSKRISTEIKLTIIGILISIFSKNKNKKLSFANPLVEQSQKQEQGLRNPLLDQELDQEKIPETKEEYKKITEDFQEIAKKFADRDDFSESFQNLFSEPELEKGPTTDKDLIDFSEHIDFKNLKDDDMKKINALFHTVLKSLNEEEKNSFTPEKFTEEFFKNFQSKEEPNFKLDKKDLETLKIDFFKLAKILTSDDPIKKFNEIRKDLISELQKGVSKDIKDKNNIKVIASIAEINNASGRIRGVLEGMKKETKKEVFEEARKNTPEQSFENIRKRSEKDPFADLSKEVLDYVDKKVEAGEGKSFERNNTKINIESVKETGEKEFKKDK